jgi:hypothetical protein
VIYVNDDRDRWDSDAPAVARAAANGSGGEIIQRDACATTDEDLEETALR